MRELIEHAPSTSSYTEMAADVYDALYSTKDYADEASRIKQIVHDHKRTAGNDLLDVACGTGLRLPFLIDDFSVTGVDLSEQQLTAAKRRLPEVEFLLGDMRLVNLDRQFDVITCLFSSIGYIYPLEKLQETFVNFARHLKPGGVLLVEPWLMPKVFTPGGAPHTDFGNLPEKGLKVSRTACTSLEGNILVMLMDHVIETPDGYREFTEEHRLASYASDEYRNAFEQAGLSFEEINEGLSRRRLYIGEMPLCTAPNT